MDTPRYDRSPGDNDPDSPYAQQRPDYQGGQQPGYSEGYQQGHQPGYQQGHQPGYQNGYQQGQQPGYQQGHQPGYQNGYQQGHQPGYQNGYQQGPQPGYQNGYQQGPGPGSAQGESHKRNSVIMGVIGLFLLGIVLGPLAIWQASKAEALGVKATAGKVLGWIDLVFGVLGLFVVLGGGGMPV